MNIKQKFNSIDQSKLDSKQVEILKNIEQKTDGFKTKDKEVVSKINMALDKIISALKEKNPEAIKSKKTTTSKTKTQKSSGGGKRTLFTIAKDIRKSDETWEQAKSRAKKIMEDENKQTTQKMKSETEKLLAFIKRKKELDGLSGTSVKKDSKIEALPKGRRVSKKGWKNQYGESEGGKVYYENRDNRTDRLAPNFADKIYLADGGAIIGTPETPLARDLGIDYTGLVGETGAMSSGELFMSGGSVDKNFDLSTYHKYKDLQGYDLKEAQKVVDRQREIFNDYKKTKFILIKITKLHYEIWTNANFGGYGERVYEAGGGATKKFEYVPYQFIYRELDDPDFTPEIYSPEAVKDFIKDFNNDMETKYKNWEDFNKGEETRNFQPIMIKQRKFADGGAIIGTPETPLARDLGIDYTGLVGETGAMSSGEMFADGGGVDKWIGYDKDHLMNMKNGMIVLRGTDLKDIKPKDIKGFDMLDNRGYADGGGVEYEQKLKRRLSFINQDVERIFKNAPKDFLEYPVKDWDSIGTLLSNIEIASNLKDNESDNWKYATGGSTGLPAGAEQHFVNYYLGEGTAQGIYAMGGSLGNHGLKQGDQIIKTMSGGVQKVKTKSGDIVYVNLANGYRGAEPPLPFVKGGSLGEELMGGQSDATLKPSGYHLVSAKGREIIVSDDGGNSKERWVKNNGFSGYRLVYKGNDYEFTDSFDDGGETKRNLSRDRMFKNNSQKYEVRYAKNKPNRRGYGYAHGGYVTITNPTEQLFKKGYRIYGGDSWETFEDVKRAYADMDLKDKMIVKVVTNNNTYFAIAEKERSFAEGGFMTDPTFGDFQNQVYDGGGEMNSDKETMIYANQLLRRAVMKGDLTQEEANSALAYEIAEDEVEDFIDDDMEEMGSSDFGYMYRNFINSYNEVKAKSFATGGGVGKKQKSWRERRNEYLEKLGSKEADVWDKIGAESGSDIRNSDKMLKAYAEGVEEMLQKEGVGKGSFDQEDYDFYTDENWHLFNEFLVWNGYYEPEMTKTEKAWREDRFKDPKMRNYVSNPSIIKVSGSSKGKSTNYVSKAKIKQIVLEKGGKEIVLESKDVLNGVNLYDGGGKLKNDHVYFAKRYVKEVITEDGDKLKPSNGYWVKKSALKDSKKEEYKVMSNQAIFPKRGVGTYWYVENSKGQTINNTTGKPYKGKELTNYYFLNEEGAKKFAEKLNSSTFEGGRNTKIVVTSIKDIPNFKEELEAGKITYRGLGLGKLYDDFYEVAGEGGKRIKVKGKEYYITDTEFNTFSRDSSGKLRIKFDAPKRKSYEGGGKTTFKEKATAIAKKFEGKKVEPKYQKEYGKTYDKAEAKEVGNKIAGSQKAKYDSKMSGGGSTKRGGSMVLAKQIRKEGESWASALKRANEQMRNK